MALKVVPEIRYKDCFWLLESILKKFLCHSYSKEDLDPSKMQLLQLVGDYF